MQQQPNSQGSRARAGRRWWPVVIVSNVVILLATVAVMGGFDREVSHSVMPSDAEWEKPFTVHTGGISQALDVPGMRIVPRNIGTRSIFKASDAMVIARDRTDLNDLPQCPQLEEQMAALDGQGTMCATEMSPCSKL